MAKHRTAVWSRLLRWRRPAKTVVPVQRERSIELVDARTKLAHQVSPDALNAGRQRGDYQARCGARVLAASMTEPGRGYCPECLS
jgi:hypothetical protein